MLLAFVLRIRMGWTIRCQKTFIGFAELLGFRPVESTYMKRQHGLFIQVKREATGDHIAVTPREEFQY